MPKLTCCNWNAEIRDEVLVFEDGSWAKNLDLFQSIKSATFDNLVLHGNLKQDIKDDLANFFDARSVYETYDVPWNQSSRTFRSSYSRSSE